MLLTYFITLPNHCGAYKLCHKWGESINFYIRRQTVPLPSDMEVWLPNVDEYVQLTPLGAQYKGYFWTTTLIKFEERRSQFFKWGHVALMKCLSLPTKNLQKIHLRIAAYTKTWLPQRHGPHCRNLCQRWWSTVMTLKQSLQLNSKLHKKSLPTSLIKHRVARNQSQSPGYSCLAWWCGRQLK